MVRRSARQQTQAHKSADKLEMMKDMKASRARQAGAEGDSDTDEVSERRAKETRRNIREMDVASSSDDDDDDDASELEEEGASESHDEAQSLVSDEEPEGGGEAPLEDVMAMQVCLFALLLRAPHAGTLLFVRALMAMPQRLRRRA
jgi:hypothetical protein